MRGRITTGQYLRYGGDGVSTATGTQPYPWMFDGNPVTNTGWTEAGAGNVAADRRGLLSAGPYSLPVGGSRLFEVAYVFAQGAGGGPSPQLASVGALQQAASEVLTRYQSGALGTPRALAATGATLAIAPNPASGSAVVYTSLPAGIRTATLSLRDGLGRVVRTLPVDAAAPTPLDLRGLAAGLYHATLSGPDGRALAAQRVVVRE